MKTMDEAHAEDMRVDADLQDARRLLLALSESFEGENLAGDLQAMADVLWEERQRIVRRWD